MKKLFLLTLLSIVGFAANAAPFTSAVNLVLAGSAPVNNVRTFTVTIVTPGYYQILVTEIPGAGPVCLNPYIIGTTCYYNTLFTVNSIKEAGALLPATAYLAAGIHKITVNSKVAPHAKLVNEVPIGFSMYIFSVTGPI
jgi:hypothetical protein